MSPISTCDALPHAVAGGFASLTASQQRQAPDSARHEGPRVDTTMTIHTARFGELEIDEKLIVHFPDGIMPFGKNLDFALLVDVDDSPTAWLQSLQYPELAFWAGHAAKLFPEHEINIDRHHIKLMQTSEPEQLCVLVIISIQDGKPVANLLAPILLNIDQGVGRQIILSGNLDLVRVSVPIEALATGQPA